MAEVTARDAKLIQYLNEAFGTEKRLETALQAHIAMTTRAPYKKRLQQHLQETKRHAREVERRIKKLGGKAGVDLPGPGSVTDVAQTAQTIAQKGAALAQGPMHLVRGSGEQEILLKNARTEYQSEAEEIAHYTAIEALAAAVGDKETQRLAAAIRREEQRMAGFLQKLIPQLTKAVAVAEIPAAERNGGRRRRTTRRRSSGGTRRSSGRAAASSRRRSSSSSRRTTGRSTSRRSAASGRGRTTRARSGTSRSGSSRGRSTSARSGSSRSGSSRSGSSRGRSTSARSSGSRRTTGRTSSGASRRRRSGGSRS
jgi:ferritin-like metal-binding protein YciE